MKPVAVRAAISLLSCLLVLLSTAGVTRASDSAESLLEKADQIRNPSDSYFIRVEVDTAGADPGHSLFEVSIADDRTLIRTLEPERNKGRNLLMLGEEMWAYVPNLKRSVRVALNQRLTGQAANGDISRMRWHGDYDAAFDDTATAGSGETVLFLKARKKGLTYEKIRVWLEADTAKPLHADFLTLAGMTLKRATYTDYGSLAGSIRPRKIVIQDAIREAERSTIHIVSMENRKFPDSLFTQSQLDH